jgi:hypothetical protein
VDTGVGSTLARPYMRWGRLPRAALGDFESLPRPAFDWAIFGLLAYGAAVGPLSFLLVRRLGRPLLTLAIVPLFALAFGAAFGALVLVQRESDLVATKATVIRGVGGELGFSRSYVSLFARRGGRYELQAPTGGLLFALYYPFPMRSYTDTPDWALDVGEGLEPRIENLGLVDGSLATFAMDSR